MLLRIKFFTHMIQQIQQCPVRIMLPAAGGRRHVCYRHTVRQSDTITHLSASGCFPILRSVSPEFSAGRWLLFPPCSHSLIPVRNVYFSLWIYNL